MITIHRERHHELIKTQMLKMIKYLRWAEKISREKDCTTTSGIDVIHLMLNKGEIDLELFLKLKEVIENPDIPIEITVE